MQVREVNVVKYKKVLSSPSTGPSRSGHKDFCFDGHVGWLAVTGARPTTTALHALIPIIFVTSSVSNYRTATITMRHSLFTFRPTSENLLAATTLQINKERKLRRQRGPPNPFVPSIKIMRCSIITRQRAPPLGQLRG